jgi:hypothetical protein
MFHRAEAAALMIAGEIVNEAIRGRGHKVAIA